MNARVFVSPAAFVGSLYPARRWTVSSRSILPLRFRYAAFLLLLLAGCDRPTQRGTVVLFPPESAPRYYYRVGFDRYSPTGDQSCVRIWLHDDTKITFCGSFEIRDEEEL